MFDKAIVVDCRAHMLGRLASIIAKELLNGQQVVAVRCEDINISGSLYRNRLNYMNFLRKTCNVNPRKHGPWHFRAPSKILWRTVRGMLPHKTKKGQQALARLTVTEGVPPPYDKTKRMVIPDALRVKRLRPGRKFCVLGELSTTVGWKYAPIVQELEEKRKVVSEAHFKRQKAINAQYKKAVQAANKDAKKSVPVLAKFGFA